MRQIPDPGICSSSSVIQAERSQVVWSFRALSTDTQTVHGHRSVFNLDRRNCRSTTTLLFHSLLWQPNQNQKMTVKLSNAIVLLVILTIASVLTAFNPVFKKVQCCRCNLKMMSDNTNDALSRRRKRRGKDEVTVSEVRRVAYEI